jgi:hypothetical protein
MVRIKTNARFAKKVIAGEDIGASNPTLLQPNPRPHVNGSPRKEGPASTLKHASSLMSQVSRTPLLTNPLPIAMKITLEEPTKEKAKEKEKAKPKAKVKAKVKEKAKAKAKAKVRGIPIRTDPRAKTRILWPWKIK